MIGELPVDIAAGSVDHVNYVAADTVERLVLKTMDTTAIERRVKLTEERLTAPVKKNTEVGTLELYYEGQLLGSVGLVTNTEVDKSELLSVFGTVKAFLFGSTMKTITRVVLGLILAFVAFTIGAKIYYAVKKAKKELEKRDRNR